MDSSPNVEEGNVRRIRVPTFPWLDHGHISPFLELAKRLASKNFYIFFSTPINLSSMEHQLSRDRKPENTLIELVELNLPSLPDLPPHYHTTKSLPPHLMPTWIKAFDLSSPSSRDILSTIKPDLLVYDFTQPWAPTLASKLNIPAVQFFHLKSVNKSTEVVLINTFEEIEEKYPDYISSVYGKEFVPACPLVQNAIDSTSCEMNKFSEWLRQEVPYGLELIEVNFIWVIRFLAGDQKERDGLAQVLAKGLMERVGEKRLVVEKWAPQAKIDEEKGLAPIIAMPVHLDQPINARLVVEIKMGEVIRKVLMSQEGREVQGKAVEMSETLIHEKNAYSPKLFHEWETQFTWIL
ncbi:hypothetical protein MKX01_030094 [Papaver californicum]|nr:hypothetical protein MKX01_030094 [Papaver californicum]